MTRTFIDLLTSKKFLAAVSAIAVYIAGRFGFDLDPAALDHIFAALLVYVGAQGVADAGKSAAAIRAVADNHTSSVANADALRRVAGTVSVIALVLFAFGTVTMTACGSAPKAKAVEVAGKDAVVKCAKADSGQLLALVAELAADAAGSALHVGGIDWDGLVAKAKSAGIEVGGCAFAAFYKAIDDAEPAMMTRSLTDVPDARRAAMAHLREAFGGPRWELAGGIVL